MTSIKRILVVEDETAIRLLIVELLIEEGYDVIGVNRAYKALNVLTHQAIDLITLDLAMPGMNGNEFLGELALKGDSAATIPVIVVSANTNLLQATPQVKKVILKPF